MRSTITVAALVTGLGLSGCSNIEADPLFLVIEVGESSHHLNVVSGRPRDLASDDRHKQWVGRERFDSAVCEGDHVVCHLVEDGDIELTDCRKVDSPPSK